MFKKNKKLVAIAVAILIVLIIGGFLAFGDANVNGHTAVVTRGDISQQVSVTGRLEPVDDVSLSFNRSGKVTEVRARVGDLVKSGQVVAVLDHRSALIELEEAKVAYQDLVNVDELDVIKAENTVKADEAALASSYDDARAALSAESKVLNDSVNSLDDLFSSDGYLTSVNFGAGAIAKTRRNAAESLFADFQRSLRSFSKIYDGGFISNDQAKIESALAELYQVSTLGARATKEAKDLVIYLKEREYGDEAEAEEAYEAVSDLALSVDDAVDQVFEARDAILQNKRSLAEAKLDLADVVNGPDSTDLRSSQLAIQQKEKEYSDYFITSPIAGVITKQEAEVGEQASAGEVVVAVISADRLQIEANVPEIDIGRVALGYPVDIVFDAFPDEHFTGQVVVVDPAQTVIDGVVNFKVTITLDRDSSVLRSGLTANITIKSNLVTDVVMVPRAALVEQDGAYFVTVVNGRQTEKRSVTVGALGQIGNVEIVNGLAPGEVVLLGEE